MGGVADRADPPPRAGRAESRESIELRALKEKQPELREAIEMHLELLDMERRIRTRVPLPSIELSARIFAEHQSAGRPLLRFADIPLEPTDLRLAIRQTAEILRRFGALEEAECQHVLDLGRDPELPALVAAWYRAVSEGAGPAAPAAAPAPVPGEPFDQVFTLAMRPFLSRCAEAVQQRPELAAWRHAHCALCGGEPDFAVITPAAERHLICGRCGLRWNFEPLTCPYCCNGDRARITSFATPDGQYRVYACDICRRYLKAYDGRRATRPVMPVVDGLATLPLDAAAIQRGYSG